LNARQGEIERIVWSLPPLNRRTLEFCVKFFNELIRYQAKNRMTAYNIAVTVSPNIFRSDSDQAISIVNHSVYYDAFIIMIESCEEIFKDRNEVILLRKASA